MPGLLTTTTASLNFLSPNVKEKPYWYRDPPAGKPDTNIVTEPISVPVTDLRSLSEEQKQDLYGLDKSGFLLRTFESAEKDFTDDAQIEKVYYPEVEKLLKETTGCSRVIIFDHTLRRRKHDAPGDAPGNRGPGLKAHADQTNFSGESRIKMHAGDEYEKLSKCRAQIINVWKPIHDIVYDTPLAFVDYRSVDMQKDLAASDLIYPARTGETYNVRHNPDQKWYYLSRQQPDEVAIFKCYESEEKEGRALLTVHSAFLHPEVPVGTPNRQSIEVRALVFYE